ncbi:hypothetical protein EPR50_G00062030, partial [Perca flavescens]
QQCWFIYHRVHFVSGGDKSTHSRSYINRLGQWCLLLCFLEKREYNTSDTMNKLLVITVLVALLALSTESFRMPRQAEEEQGTLTKITGTIRSYYDNVVDVASGYVDSIKGLKLEEKAKHLYTDTTTVVSTYAGILHDQVYHIFYHN